MIPRRVALLGLAALILAGAGIAAAATYTDDEDTPAALEQPVTTTTSVLPDETTTTTAAAVTSTTTPAPSTTVAGASTTTTRRGATTTTARAGATTTTTDKASYGQTEPVRIHSTLRNRSATTCTYPSFVFAATILSPAGATITGFSGQGDAPGALGPGQATEASVSWDRLGCAPQPCTQSTPGTYSVSVTWHFPGGPYTDTRSFQLT